MYVGENNVEVYYWSDVSEVAFYWEEATDSDSRVHSYKAYLVRQAAAWDNDDNSRCSPKTVAWLGGEEQATFSDECSHAPQVYSRISRWLPLQRPQYGM